MTLGPVLPDEPFAKAVVYMRALRRAVISFWYATIEDVEAARIDAVQACLVVNILDEAVFERALGELYRQIRAKDRLGRVVTGPELVRNCETHAPCRVRRAACRTPGARRADARPDDLPGGAVVGRVRRYAGRVR